MRAKHSSHNFMSVTGGLAGVRRAGCPVSVERGSSTQMSAVSSDISTNSRFRIFLTTLGSSETAGLYGPADVTGSVSCPGVRLPSSVCGAVAAAARRSRPVARLGVAENTGIDRSCAGSGIVPSSPPAASAVRTRSMKCGVICPQFDLRACACPWDSGLRAAAPGAHGPGRPYARTPYVCARYIEARVHVLDRFDQPRCHVRPVYI